MRTRSVTFYEFVFLFLGSEQIIYDIMANAWFPHVHKGLPDVHFTTWTFGNPHEAQIRDCRDSLYMCH